MTRHRSLTAMASVVAVVTMAGCTGAGHSSSPATPPPTSAGAGPTTTSSAQATSTTAAPAPPGLPLAAIQFVGPSTGWVVGAGRILATTDGGAHWLPQYAGPLDFVGLDAISGQTAWAVAPSALIGTTDGGHTWSPLSEPPEPLDSVHFATPALGWAVAGGNLPQPNVGVQTPGTGAELVATTDGGRTWAPSGQVPNSQTVCFADSHNGWAGALGAVYRSTNAGRTWNLASTLGGGLGGTVIVQCAGPHVVWALVDGLGAATGHSGYLLYRGDDTGNWRLVIREPFTQFSRPGPDGPTSYPGPISALDADHAVFVGESPPASPPNAVQVVFVGPEGPEAGTTRPIPPLQGVEVAAFVSQTLGWVIGQTAGFGATLLVHTVDGGRSWHTQLSLPS